MGFCMGNFSSAVLPDAIKSSIGETGIPKYGVKFDGTNSAGVRTYDAANLNWAPSTSAVAGVDNFKSILPFKTREVIRQYNSTSGVRETLAYEGDTNYSSLVSSKTGDRMIEFTASYYRRTSENEYIVSPKTQDGFSINPAFWHGGKMYNHCAISKYNIGTGYVIQPGTATLVNTNMNTFRTNLRAKGLNLLDYQTYCGIAMLMLVKYANMNLQSVVGMGYNSGNTTYSSGNSDGVKGVDGSATSLTANEAVLTMGIENFYGNCWKYMDGAYTYNGNMYIKDVLDMTTDPSSTADLSSYTKLSTGVITGAGSAAIKNIAYDSTYNYLLYPVSIGSPNPSGDACWSNNTLDFVSVGGSGWNGASDGLFAFDCGITVGGTGVNRGGLAVEFYD